MMLRVTTGSRLHFGLFSLPGPSSPSSMDRQCGGVGMMVEQPGVAVRVEPAQRWSATGACAERAGHVLEKLSAGPGEPAASQAFAVHVESCPPEHVGLGTGTQLSLAIALAIDAGRKLVGGQEKIVPDAASAPTAVGDASKWISLARRLGRGERSALGIHGFLHGGFLVEGGKGASATVSPLVARAEFPDVWRVVLIVPAGGAGCHGQRERQAFAGLAQLQTTANQRDVLCRLTLLGLLPALHETDLPAFGEALFEFNRRVGEMFRPAQGGIYSQPATEELVQLLRGQGVHGVGQSSWGPAVFAVAEADRAEHLARLVRERFALRENEVIVTRGHNRGARIGG